MSVTAVIPARFASSRFPGKPLALISGKPMIHHVIERCREARSFDRVIVATDDERIAAAVRAFGGDVAMTSATCASGTDRVAEVARQLGLGADAVVVNVQGDEPALHPEALWALARAFDDAAVTMATLVRALRDEERTNPTVVKVVTDERGRALYFSRADIPFQRDAHGPTVERLGHVGIYGYRASTLQTLAALAPTRLEQMVSLEQLRALGHGVTIQCVKTKHGSAAVDRPEDVSFAEAALAVLPKTYPP
jgi:3-deoxy-manno-octulosonate cytidylyltransferase (CMP-KDO synthetase)